MASLVTHYELSAKSQCREARCSPW